MNKAYRALAALIALGVVVQAAAIAYAWFQVIVDLEGGAVLTSDSDGNVGHALHGIVGMMVIPLLALLLLVTSPFAKVKGASKWAGFVLLAVVAQVVLAFVSFGVAAVGALHGINALVVLTLALITFGRSGGSRAASGSATAQVPQQAGASQQSSSV